MEQKYRKLINKELPKLACDTCDVPSIANKLLDKKIINPWMKDHILDSSLSHLLQAQRLYQVIQARGPQAFFALCKTLDETNNVSARKLLLAAKNIDDDEKPASLRLNCSELYVKIHPDRIRMDTDDEEIYHMGSNPKGHAFILNINKTVGKDDRSGSSVDTDSLNKLFKGLGYSVELQVDLTKEQTISAIEQFIHVCRFKKIDSIAVFIMGHGAANKDNKWSSDILTSDGNSFNTDWLIEQFKSDKLIKNVPKMIFIQACRGENSDFGHRLSIGENSLQNDSTSIVIPSNENVVYQRCYEDMFISWATVPGYNAKRHPVDGSWFVQTLCEVLRNNAWKFDLEHMIKIVDRKIKLLNCSVNGYQTVEWLCRGFNKKFYFNPGLYDDDDCTGDKYSSESR